MFPNGADIYVTEGIDENSPVMRHFIIYAMMRDVIPDYHNVNRAIPHCDCCDDEEDEENDEIGHGPMMLTVDDEDLSLWRNMMSDEYDTD